MPAPGDRPLRAPKTDYLRAYSLRRPFLTKGFFSIVLTALAGAAAIGVPLAGWHWAFQPGKINDSHTRAGAGCMDCHVPFRGPAGSQCAECHARPEHSVRAANPDCSECHFEHRGKESLTRVSDSSCVACHGVLEVTSGVPAVDRTIQSFPETHPEFSVRIGGRRLPLAQAAGADPTPLRFGHRRHLEKPMLTPTGERVALTCESCHKASSEEGVGPTEMRAVEYETACAGCHLLTFDPRLDDQQAPHGEPARVREFLVAMYSDRRDQALSIREARRRLIRGGPSPVPRLDLSARATEAVVDAERYLYGTACQECHTVDMDAGLVPAVARPAIPAGWLDPIPFPHERHLRVAGMVCADCHAGAERSAATSDVLIPGISTCGGCHGGTGQPPGRAVMRPGPSQCWECHKYHPTMALAPPGGERTGG
jgi:hypothetical protein